MIGLLYHFKAEAIKITDGDTIIATIDKGHGEYHKRKIRVYQEEGLYFDTPEVKLYRGVTEAHKEHGLEAKARAEEILMGKELIIKTHKSGPFRWLGEIFYKDTDNIWKSYVDTMVEEGFQKKESYE